MASRKGVAATMFGALAKANINIRCRAGAPLAVHCACPPRTCSVHKPLTSSGEIHCVCMEERMLQHAQCLDR